jgi:hypothetical protein
MGERQGRRIGDDGGGGGAPARARVISFVSSARVARSVSLATFFSLGPWFLGVLSVCSVPCSGAATGHALKNP